MHPVVDLQYSANKLSFDFLAHIDLFEGLNETVKVNFNLSHFITAFVLPLMLDTLIHQNVNLQTLS